VSVVGAIVAGGGGESTGTCTQVGYAVLHHHERKPFTNNNLDFQYYQGDQDLETPAKTGCMTQARALDTWAPGRSVFESTLTRFVQQPQIADVYTPCQTPGMHHLHRPSLTTALLVHKHWVANVSQQAGGSTRQMLPASLPSCP
jgi:hypothetical protein